MPYRKANRHVTEEQFSEGTTIDGSRIDKAVEDIIEHQNEIPTGDMEARWMPTTYTLNFSPSKSKQRMADNPVNLGLTSTGIGQTTQIQESWFPFLMSHNGPSEVYPAVDQPETTPPFTNEYRSKGYYTNQNDAYHENRSRSAYAGIGAPAQIDGGNTNMTFYNVEDANNVNTKVPVLQAWINPSGIPGAPGTAIQNPIGTPVSSQFTRYITMTIPFYFSKPVIITNISVFAGQEHPISYFNGLQNDPAAATLCPNIDPNLGLKNDETCVATYESCDSYMPYDSGATVNAIEANREAIHDASVAWKLPAKAGREVPGELYTPTQRNIGDGTVQVSIDNEFLKEQRELNNIVFSKSYIEDSAYRFNLMFPTANRGISGLAADTGATYQDMEPRFAGGPTWGCWMQENNLNIPVPRDSRVRFQVIAKGVRAVQLFDWHISMTVLEQVED
tara:strand:+ start:3848 stop:5188 length:1341 start_codon:yes stop_codon:yes gene_type:complete